jgi:hypothetical protein
MHVSRPISTIPPEIHLLVLEFFLSDNPVPGGYRYHTAIVGSKTDDKPTPLSHLIRVSHVCRAWWYRVHSVLFQHLDVHLGDLNALMNFDISLYDTTSKSYATPTLLSTLPFIQILTLDLSCPAPRLGETMLLLQHLPNLTDLNIRMLIEMDRKRPIVPSHSTSVPQVKRLCLRVAYELHHRWHGLGPDDIWWILSCFPSAKHWMFALSGDICDANADKTPPFIPPANLVSLSSERWVWWLMGPNITYPSIRYFDISRIPNANLVVDFIRRHRSTLESLCIDDPYPWEIFVPCFSSMRHLAFQHSRGDPWELLQAPRLCHFEFLWIGEFDTADDWFTILAFLDRCPLLQVVTYHSMTKFQILEDFCRQRSLQIIWKESKDYGCWRAENVGFGVPGGI